MSSEALDRASYYLALEGVTRYGLAEAVKTILQNGLGHAFFPSPPELRGQCDKAMAPHEDQRARAVRYERIAKEQAECRPVQKTPEQIARARRLLAGFHAQYEKPEAKIISNLDPALVAQLPDNPAARQRMGLKE